MSDAAPEVVTPTCSKCGAEITTGAMVLYCPHNERCEFYPDDAESQAIIARWREVSSHD